MQTVCEFKVKNGDSEEMVRFCRPLRQGSFLPLGDHGFVAAGRPEKDTRQEQPVATLLVNVNLPNAPNAGLPLFAPCESVDPQEVVLHRFGVRKRLGLYRLRPRVGYTAVGLVTSPTAQGADYACVLTTSLTDQEPNHWSPFWTISKGQELCISRSTGAFQLLTAEAQNVLHRNNKKKRKKEGGKKKENGEGYEGSRDRMLTRCWS
jgi:hypothetical protein